MTPGLRNMTRFLAVAFASALTLIACEKKADAKASAATAASVPSSSSAGAAPVAPVSKAATPSTATTAVPDKVVVYYFHGNRRCRTCVGIGETVARTVSERFASEVKSGRLEFQQVNVDQPEHQHFIPEYQLSSPTMVVTARSGRVTAKWENCIKVWEYGHDATALSDYAEKQIRAYLAMLKRG